MSKQPTIFRTRDDDAVAENNDSINAQESVTNDSSTVYAGSTIFTQRIDEPEENNEDLNKTILADSPVEEPVTVSVDTPVEEPVTVSVDTPVEEPKPERKVGGFGSKASMYLDRINNPQSDYSNQTPSYEPQPDYSNQTPSYEPQPDYSNQTPSYEPQPNYSNQTASYDSQPTQNDSENDIMSGGFESGDVVTYKGNYKPPVNKTPFIILIAALAVAVLVGVMWYLGVFLSPQQKAVKAITRTLSEKDPFWEEQFGVDSIVKKPFELQTTTTTNISILGQSVDSKANGKVQVDMDNRQMGFDLSGIKMYLDGNEGEMRMQMPQLSRDVYVYKSGNLVIPKSDMSMPGGDLMVYAISPQLKKVRAEKLAKEFYTVNNQSVKCNGYRFYIPKQYVEEGLKYFEENMNNPSYEKMLQNNFETDEPIASLLDESISEPLVVDVYMYRGKMTALTMKLQLKDERDMEYKITAAGGSYSMENMEIASTFHNDGKAKNVFFGIHSSTTKTNRDLELYVSVSELVSDKISLNLHYTNEDKTFTYELITKDVLSGQQKSLITSGNGKVTKVERGRNVQFEMSTDQSAGGAYSVSSKTVATLHAMTGSIEKPTGSEKSLNSLEEIVNLNK